MCPEVEVADCGSWPADGPTPCPADMAAAWLPNPEFVDEVAWDWPWDVTFFARGDPYADMPGATGWSCGLIGGTLDAADSVGDGDGYPDVFDCDNGDEDVVPSLPPSDGVSTSDCDPAGTNCWVCPPGTEGDDDDSGTGDDDDSAEGGDDDDSAGRGGGGLVQWGQGCAGGCGFSWSCDEGVAAALLFIVPGLWTRRRRYRTNRADRSID